MMMEGPPPALFSQPREKGSELGEGYAKVQSVQGGLAIAVLFSPVTTMTWWSASTTAWAV